MTGMYSEIHPEDYISSAKILARHAFKEVLRERADKTHSVDDILAWMAYRVEPIDPLVPGDRKDL